MEPRIILSTCNTMEKAEEIAGVLVEQRLAACVNLLPAIQSIYTWQGKIEKDQEILLIIKSSSSKLAELEQQLLALHPYDTPEFVALKPEYVSPKYLDWLSNSLI